MGSPWQSKRWVLLASAFGVGCAGAFAAYRPLPWGLATLAFLLGLAALVYALRPRRLHPMMLLLPRRPRGVFSLRRWAGHLWYERRPVVAYVELPELFALVVPRGETDEDGSWNELIFLQATRWRRWCWRQWLRTTQARPIGEDDVEWHIARCMVAPSIAPADQALLQAPSPPPLPGAPGPPGSLGAPWRDRALSRRLRAAPLRSGAQSVNPSPSRWSDAATEEPCARPRMSALRLARCTALNTRPAGCPPTVFLRQTPQIRPRATKSTTAEVRKPTARS